MSFETINRFPKDQLTKAQVEIEAEKRRNDPGVEEVRIEEDRKDWILITVKRVIP